MNVLQYKRRSLSANNFYAEFQRKLRFSGAKQVEILREKVLSRANFFTRIHYIIERICCQRALTD